MMNRYEKVNAEPLEIVTTGYTYAGFNEPERGTCEAFWFDGRYYNLDEFARTHNNPWMGGDYPDYIHGVEIENYYNPIYIEVIEAYDPCVNVYRYVE